MSKKTDLIISLLSNNDLEKELSKDVRERWLEQKLFYATKKMAKNYYDSVVLTDFSEKDYEAFLKNNISKKEKTAIVSLGCGNASREKYALEQMKKNGYDFIYIGVDTSEHMLKMAIENLKEIKIEKKFVQIDITNDGFKDVIAELAGDCDKRMYMFLGGTIGNVNQTNVADVLYNILQKGDSLWVDVRIRPSLSKEDDIKLFKQYSSRLTMPEELSFYFGPLGNIGASIKSGTMGLKVSGEKSVGSLLFIFYFKIQKKIVIDFMGERTHLLPSEEVELFNIRAYHPKTLINFFKEHEFKLIDENQKGTEGQFMFAKK